MRHLTPTRLLLEILMSCFSTWWAAGVLTDLAAGKDPTYWVGIDNSGVILSYLLLFASVIHVIGVRVNGRWVGSPYLRVLAMLIGAGAFLFLAYHGRGSTAFHTYSFISLLYVLGLVSSFADIRAQLVLRRAWNKS